MRFRAAALATLAAVAVALSGCAAGGAGGDSDDLRVTMIAYPPGDDFYYTIEKSAAAEAEKLGVALTVQKMPTYEASAQISILNAAIATQPDAIIVSPVDPNALQGALERAREAGIQIILYDTTTRDPSVAATMVSGDIVELGRTAARYFLEQVGDRSGSVFYQGTAPAHPFFEALHDGWTEVLGSKSGLKHLAVNYSDFEPSKAASQMQSVLTANQDLIGGFAGIFLDQQGNIPAIENAGKKGELVVVAVDGAPQNVQRLRDGHLAAIVSVKAHDYGIESIRAAVAAVDGKTLPAHTVIGSCLLTIETVDDPANSSCLYELDKG